MSRIINPAQVCRIAPGVRLQFEKAQGAWVLLYPEGMVTLDETAGDILRAIDGRRSVRTVIQSLLKEYGEAEGLADDVVEFLQNMADQGWVRCDDE